MKKVGMIFFVFLFAGMGLWWYLFPSYSWHQKMTVEVEVNGQVYSGSSVVEMTVSDRPPFPLVHGGAGRDLDMRGEAVVVELPESRYLFALLTFNAFLARDVFEEFHGEAMKGMRERWAKVISDLRETRDIAPKDYPLLVTFTDISDPKTVREVDPANLAATFGPGVLLKRLRLEITDEDVTEEKIESVLGWLDDPKVMKNPAWRNLPYLSQTAIYGLRTPVKPVK